MFFLSDYQVQGQIYDSANSEVYRAIRDSDRQRVILKVLKQDYPTPAEITRYKQEYELTNSLNIEGVIKVFGLEKYHNTFVMFVEDFGGESLKILQKDHQFSLEEFISISIKIATSLGQIHAANIIHKKEIDAADNAALKRKEKIQEYEDLFSNPYCAARRGYIDAVIVPSDTRPRLIDALEIMCAKREISPPKKHGNIPL